MICLLQEVLAFRDKRNWKQFHNPKDLAISITLEAGELLENFQWKNSEEAVKEKAGEIEEELADVFIYALLLANELGINPKEAVRRKIKRNAEKYPIEKAYGSNKKYSDF